MHMYKAGPWQIYLALPNLAVAAVPDVEACHQHQAPGMVRNIARMCFEAGILATQVLRAAEAVADRTSRAIIGYGDHPNPSTKTVHRLVADYMEQAVNYDWTSYRAQCQPQYCDFVLQKTVLNRVSELLSTVGGLWTVVLSVTTLLWAGLGMLSCSRKAGSAYFVWHC